jgi:hypothetical protein
MQNLKETLLNLQEAKAKFLTCDSVVSYRMGQGNETVRKKPSPRGDCLISKGHTIQQTKLGLVGVESWCVVISTNSSCIRLHLHRFLSQHNGGCCSGVNGSTSGE